MNEKLDLDTVEKIPMPNREGMISTLIRNLKKELRIIYDGLYHGLADSLHLLKRIIIPQAVDKAIKPQASWFEIQPNDPNGRGVLLCHGFAATPEIFHQMAIDLAAEGYYVRGIRLAGHGTSVAHLAQTTSVEWFASVVWHYQEISKDYDDITYVGHSLGGTLGMLLATIYPITSFVAMCAPVELDIPPAKFVREASILVKYWPRSRGKIKSLNRTGISSYRATPLYAVGGIFEASKLLRKRSDKLTIPLLYISAAMDHKTLIVQPEKVRKYLTSTPVTFKVAENSPHSLLQGPEYPMIRDWVIDWIADHPYESA